MKAPLRYSNDKPTEWITGTHIDQDLIDNICQAKEIYTIKQKEMLNSTMS